MHRINCADISKIAPDIILTSFKDRYEVELSDVKELNEIYIELAKGKKVFSIINGEHKFSHFSNESLEYLSNEAPFIVEHHQLQGSVIVVSSLPGRIIANFFLRIKRHNYPLKVVSNMDQAMNWINSLRKGD